MLIVYTPEYCKLYGKACERGKYEECRDMCPFCVKREDLKNG